VRPAFLAACLLAACLFDAAPVLGQQIVLPLRGSTPIPETNPSEHYRMERNDRTVPVGHDWQPPVIPHNIKGYQITKDVNTCLVCHSRSNAPQAGATRVPRSHFVGRDGKPLPTVSTRRYFCLQCHVPQADAEPLVGNTFKGPR
jgi:cytochrome c-type protein NapB